MPLARHVLADEPDAVSPGGGAEIRHILTSPRGDLTHAVCQQGQIAPTHLLPELDEGYFVLAGSGSIWRRDENRESSTALYPGRFVWMPAGMQFQYRADGQSLIFLVAVLPSWRPDLFHTVDAGPWAPSVGGGPIPSDRADDRWLSGNLHRAPDALAPDTSEIRLLGGVERGSLAHCSLYPGTCSLPVKHRTVHELWFVVSGHGEMWRLDPDGDEQMDLLWPGVGVDIPTGATFQFRATGIQPLEVVLLTMPRWPGGDEAIRVEEGRWQT